MPPSTQTQPGEGEPKPRWSYVPHPSVHTGEGSSVGSQPSQDAHVDAQRSSGDLDTAYQGEKNSKRKPSWKKAADPSSLRKWAKKTFETIQVKTDSIVSNASSSSHAPSPQQQEAQQEAQPRGPGPVRTQGGAGSGIPKAGEAPGTPQGQSFSPMQLHLRHAPPSDPAITHVPHTIRDASQRRPGSVWGSKLATAPADSPTAASPQHLHQHVQQQQQAQPGVARQHVQPQQQPQPWPHQFSPLSYQRPQPHHSPLLQPSMAHHPPQPSQYPQPGSMTTSSMRYPPPQQLPRSGSAAARYQNYEASESSSGGLPAPTGSSATASGSGAPDGMLQAHRSAGSNSSTAASWPVAPWCSLSAQGHVLHASAEHSLPRTSGTAPVPAYSGTSSQRSSAHGGHPSPPPSPPLPAAEHSGLSSHSSSTSGPHMPIHAQPNPPSPYMPLPPMPPTHPAGRPPPHPPLFPAAPHAMPAGPAAFPTSAPPAATLHPQQHPAFAHAPQGLQPDQHQQLLQQQEQQQQQQQQQRKWVGGAHPDGAQGDGSAHSAHSAHASAVSAPASAHAAQQRGLTTPDCSGFSDAQWVSAADNTEPFGATPVLPMPPPPSTAALSSVPPPAPPPSSAAAAPPGRAFEHQRSLPRTSQIPLPPSSTPPTPPAPQPTPLQPPTPPAPPHPVPPPLAPAANSAPLPQQPPQPPQLQQLQQSESIPGPPAAHSAFAAHQPRLSLPGINTDTLLAPPTSSPLQPHEGTPASSGSGHTSASHAHAHAHAPFPFADSGRLLLRSGPLPPRFVSHSRGGSASSSHRNSGSAAPNVLLGGFGSIQAPGYTSGEGFGQYSGSQAQLEGSPFGSAAWAGGGGYGAPHGVSSLAAIQEGQQQVQQQQQQLASLRSGSVGGASVASDVQEQLPLPPALVLAQQQDAQQHPSPFSDHAQQQQARSSQHPPLLQYQQQQWSSGGLVSAPTPLHQQQPPPYTTTTFLPSDAAGAPLTQHPQHAQHAQHAQRASHSIVSLSQPLPPTFTSSASLASQDIPSPNPYWAGTSATPSGHPSTSSMPTLPPHDPTLSSQHNTQAFSFSSQGPTSVPGLHLSPTSGPMSRGSGSGTMADMLGASRFDSRGSIGGDSQGEGGGSSSVSASRVGEAARSQELGARARRVKFGDAVITPIALPDEDRLSSPTGTGMRRPAVSDVSDRSSPTGLHDEGPVRNSVAGENASAIARAGSKGLGSRKLGASQSAKSTIGRVDSQQPPPPSRGNEEVQPMLPKPQPPPQSLGHPTRIRSERGLAAPGRLLSQVRMVQSIKAHDGVMWAMKLSADASMVATGGQDGVVRVWKVLEGGQGLASDSRLHLRAPSIGMGLDRLSSEHPVHAEGERSSKVASRHMRSSRGFTSSDNVEGAGYAPAGVQDGVGAFHEGVPVLHPHPIATFTGHTSDVLDVSWSAGNFILSASLDCTVRLWHVLVAAHGEQRQIPGRDSKSPLMAALVEEEQTVCMQGFPHPDLVTCVAFHPHNARRFATGCVDGRVRVWGVGPREGNVLASAAIAHDMVTSVSWSSDGTKLVAGTLQGKCRYYDWVPSTPSPTPPALNPATIASSAGNPIVGGGLQTSLGNPSLTGARLDYVANIDVKDRRANASAPGKKVTGLVTVPDGLGLIVASDDSRLRLYHRYTLVCKYKGLKNKHTMLRPVVTSDGKYVVCGSDDGAVYIWDRLLQIQGGPLRTDSMAVSPAGPSYSSKSGMRVSNKNPHYECFHTDEGQITNVSVLPPHTWRVPQEDAPILLRLRVQNQYNEQMRPMSHGIDSKQKRQTDSTATAASLRAQADPSTHTANAATRQHAKEAMNSPLLGALFLVGGFRGRLMVYENL